MVTLLTGYRRRLSTAEMLNTFQRELVNLVEGLGYTLNPDDDSQILKAINGVISGRLLGVQELLPAVECLQNHLVQKSGAFGC